MMKTVPNRRPVNFSNNLSGFTLVELLVVVVMILILVSLLFPALDGASAKARTVQCVNNLRNVVVGFYRYGDDHNQDLPDNTGTAPNCNFCPAAANCNSHNSCWDQEVGGYLMATYNWYAPNCPYFFCPESANLGLPWAPQWGGAGLNGAYPRSYGIACGPSYSNNHNFGAINNGSCSTRVRGKFTNILKPARAILLFDHLDWAYTQGKTQGSGALNGGQSPIHPANKANHLFVDGHVESLTKAETPDGEMWIAYGY